MDGVHAFEAHLREAGRLFQGSDGGAFVRRKNPGRTNLIFKSLGFQIERMPIQVFGAFDFHEDTEAFPFGIAILLGLDDTRPDCIPDRARLVKRGNTVEPGDSSLRQQAGLPEFGLPEKDGDFRTVLQICVGCPFTPFPKSEVIVIKHHEAAARRHLREPVRQYGGHQTYVYWKSGVDMLMEKFRNRSHGFVA